MTVKLLGDGVVVDDGENLERCTEVMMIWGMEYVLWITVMASARVLREVILIPERTLLIRLDITQPNFHEREHTLLRIDSAESNPHNE